MDPLPLFLSLKQQISYCMGHVLNDVCSCLWFTYFLVFFQYILNFTSAEAGTLMLIGQVADAISTPIVGYFSDKQRYISFYRWGRRKACHLMGTLIVLLTFPFIFQKCINCANSPHEVQMAYYGVFITIFQFGWACVQISHLALLPELTPLQHQRTRLTSLRSSIGVLAYIFVYVTTTLSMHSIGESKEILQLGPQHESNMELVVYVGISIGFITSAIFHLGVKEVKKKSETEHRTNQKTISDLMADPLAYMVAIVYACSRLFSNLSQAYIPLYLLEGLVLSAESIALVPLLMYLCSLVGSLMVHPLNNSIGRPISYMIGAVIGVVGCFWIYFSTGIYYDEYEIYLVAGLFGLSGSIMLVTTLGITTDFIGPDTDTGAFVFGCMSFTEKLSNGAALMLIQNLSCSPGCPNYYRNILAFVCSGTALAGILPLLSLCNLRNRYISPLTDNSNSPSVELPTSSMVD